MPARSPHGHPGITRQLPQRSDSTCGIHVTGIEMKIFILADNIHEFTRAAMPFRPESVAWLRDWTQLAGYNQEIIVLECDGYKHGSNAGQKPHERMRVQLELQRMKDRRLVHNHYVEDCSEERDRWNAK